MVKVFIRENQIYSQPINYILRVLAKTKKFNIIFVNEKSIADLFFDHENPDSVPVNEGFYDSLLVKKVYEHQNYFLKKPVIYNQKTNSQDWLGSAFYMINAFQEYGFHKEDDTFDEFGRFRYDKSYQKKFDCHQENLVQLCFENFCKEHLKSLTGNNVETKTKIFLSHDVDTIYGSFFQDGLWAIKKGRIDVVMKLFLNEVLMNPHWKNMDKIVKLHSANDLKSTFFWLATKKISENKIKNADYSIGKEVRTTKKSPSNGLHKSCYNLSIDEELKILPFKTTLNRFHFLKFTLPDAWNDLQKSDIQMDASLGFAENFGFRNSFGLPFMPYNINNGSSYKFVEVPMNIMDGTLHRYLKIPKKSTATAIIEFLEKHKTNSIISLLWHNTYFTDYKYSGFLDEYKKIILYFIETGIKSITPNEIINEYSKL